MENRRNRQHRRPQSKRRRKRNLILKIGLFVILTVGVIIAFFVWKKYGPTKETYDLNKYYGIENENQLAVVVDNGVLEPKGMLFEGKAYMEYSIVRDYINSRFYWDPNENVLLYTLPSGIVTVGVGSQEYMEAKEKKDDGYVVLKTEGSTAYIAMEFIQKYTDIDYQIYEDPGRIVMTTKWDGIKAAKVKRDTAVRYQGGQKSPSLTNISKKDEVIVLETEGSWKKIRTKDGFIGYVPKSSLKKEEKKESSRDFEEQVFTGITKNYRINMAWHNVTNTDANSGVLEMIARTKGLTTISPTWFHVLDTQGNLDSIASSDYVNFAHQSNIEVWGAVRDFDGGINSYDESYQMLSRTSSRDNLTNQLIASALQVGLDGINVDFEKISVEAGEHYIQFIRELAVKCHQNGLVLSVDNYVPQSYNQHYHRKEQGVVADYVVIMGYDEHYGGSPVAGPVASYNFVKAGIEKTLEEVPANKVINAIPFFTRVWKETPKTAEEIQAQAGTDAAQYTSNVESTAYSMSDADSVVGQSGATVGWDEETKYNFASWSDGVSTYKIWMEDVNSLESKLQLMKEYELAGTSAWCLGLEKQEIWELILKYVN